MSKKWIPRDIDLAAFARKWKTGLENPANVTAFGWKQAEVTAGRAAARI